MAEPDVDRSGGRFGSIRAESQPRTVSYKVTGSSPAVVSDRQLGGGDFGGLWYSPRRQRLFHLNSSSMSIEQVGQRAWNMSPRPHIEQFAIGISCSVVRGGTAVGA
jgi:hypothetical protein